jgi:hypothetical protein
MSTGRLFGGGLLRLGSSESRAASIKKPTVLCTGFRVTRHLWNANGYAVLGGMDSAIDCAAIPQHIANRRHGAAHRVIYDNSIPYGVVRGNPGDTWRVM